VSQHHREPRKPFLVVHLTDDTEPSFESFDTYEEAKAYQETVEYKAWIVGPEWIEDYS